LTDLRSKLFRYHYRFVHASFEWLLKGATGRPRRSNVAPLGAPPRRILVVKFGGMGEAVLARSLVEHLRRRHPGIIIDVLVDPRTREVMSCGSDSRLYSYDPGSDGMAMAVRLLRKVRAEYYEAAIDFEQCSLLTAAFLRATGIPIRLGFVPPSDNSRARFFTHPVELRDTDSMWKSMVRLGGVFDASLPERLCTMPLPVPREAEQFIDAWWGANIARDGTNFPAVAMHIGVGPRAQYRKWPLNRFVELAERLRRMDPKLTIILTGDHSERPLINQFKAKYSGHAVDASTISSLERTAVLLSRSDLLITNDTGVMHLGATMGTPTVAVFGASNPTYWAPVGPRATFVYKTRIPCSPCIDSYRRIIPDKCFASDASRCMLDARVDDVLNAASEVVTGPWFDGYKERRGLVATPLPGSFSDDSLD
jgi:ADP-heptose:LPS heptosyltransferase